MDSYAIALNNSRADDILRSLLAPDITKERKSFYLKLLGANNVEDLVNKLTGMMSSQLDYATTDYYPQPGLEDLFTYQLRIKIVLVAAPLLLFLGVIGNILSFAVLMRPSMRRISTYRYLAALSLADTAVLVLGLLQLWLSTIDKSLDPMALADWMCKLFTFLLCSVSTYSTWLIIAMTTERYIAVCHPLQAASFCTTSKAVKVVVLLICATMTLHLHMFVSLEVKGDPPQCRAADGYTVLIDIVWPWIDALMYSFIPSAVIIVLNGCIIDSAIKARRRRLCMLREDLRKGPRIKGGSRSHSYSRSDSGSRLTIMLLSISFTFLMTTLPVNIMLLVRPQIAKTDEQNAQNMLAIELSRLIMYINHSANLLLYCATGQKFRQQFVQVLSLRKMNWATDSFGSTIRSVAGFKLAASKDTMETDKLARINTRQRST